jgi:competence CoiA-like predicted nuclease
MLTCKIGESDVNTIDFTDEQLRKWSDKGVLKCPICNEKMIYKNGEIKIAHFAHEKGSDCVYTYYENETKYHAYGKTILYKWAKQLQNILNIKLEAWIPETRQRPDLYIQTEDGSKIVIEYQCQPITVKEYKERHELYKLAGIKDVWILGTENYDIDNSDNEIEVGEFYSDVYAGDIRNFRNYKYKCKLNSFELELKNNNSYLYYLNAFDEELYIIKTNEIFNCADKDEYGLNTKVYKTLYRFKYIKECLNNCYISDEENIFISCGTLDYLNLMNQTYKKYGDKIWEENKELKRLEKRQEYIKEAIYRDRSSRNG